jgi:hypothetical protein
MAYMTAQGLLKTLLLTVSGFSASDVTEGDLRVLDSGTTYKAVLFPGSIPEIDLAGMSRVIEYEAIIDLFVKFTDDTSYSAFGTFRDLVIAKLDALPALSDTYFMTRLNSDGAPIEIFDRQGAGPFFVTQRFIVTIEEQK